MSGDNVDKRREFRALAGAEKIDLSTLSLESGLGIFPPFLDGDLNDLFRL
jgi:hypothetical protein